MGDVICDYSQNLSNKPQMNQQLCALTLSQNTLTCPIVQTFTHSTVFSSSVFYCSHLFCSDVKFSPAEATSAKIFLQQPWRILNSELNLMLHKRYIHGKKR